MKIEVIIAPLVVFFVMVGLLVAARYYDHLPLKLPSCTFRKVTGIPCLACRGTRALRALADGKVALAAKYNPLAIIGFCLGILWVGSYVIRKGQPPKRVTISTRSVIIITSGLLIGNWIYLILTDHWFQ